MKPPVGRRLPRLAVLCAVCATLHSPMVAKGREVAESADSPPVIEPAVAYLSQTPAIDGVLDPFLQDLPVRHFTTADKSDSGNPDVALSYRLAYGAQFLYLYVEVEAETLTYRDRAYQNGDGVTVVLAHPEPDNSPSREFYVLACAAVDRPDMEWTRRRFWYYNVDKIFLPTSEDTKVTWRDG
jgi:hypothetical protein